MRAQSRALGGGAPRKRGGAEWKDHFRAGRAPGGWREHFTVAQSERYDAAIAHGLAGLPSGLAFDYGGGATWRDGTLRGTAAVPL